MKIKNLSPKQFALAATLAVTTLITPLAAQAELSANIGLATMYLFRGLDAGNSAPAISGGIDYNHQSGLYAGMWTSSAIPGDSYEQDFFLGFSGEVAGFGYDVSFWEYLYMQNASIGDTDIQELAIGGSYMDFGATFVIGFADSYKYISLDYTLGKIGLHVGINPKYDAGDGYFDFNTSYALTDQASVIISIATGDGISESQGNPLILFTYSIPLEL